MQRSQSQPVDQAFSYNTLSHMNPRTYRNHAWAQLAKSDTFYVRGSPEERALQRRLGLLEDEEGEGEGGAEDEPTDLEGQGWCSAKALFVQQGVVDVAGHCLCSQVFCSLSGTVYMAGYFVRSQAHCVTEDLSCLFAV